MNEAYANLIKSVSLKDNEYIVAAISGGPDSMALLNLLIKFKNENKINIVCAHVNHNSGRDGQYEEQEFIKKYCKEKDILFETMTIKEYTNDNFENEARNKRYDFFEKVLEKYNSRYLFTAHHGDDLIETVLMRIVRGSTLRGYSGFSYMTNKEKYIIVRPLINLTKEYIQKYNDEHGIPYSIDKTNYDDSHTRNRYRKYILPKLKDEDPNVHLKFNKFSKILVEASDYIEKVSLKKMDLIYSNNTLIIDAFLKEEKVIRTNVLYNILKQLYSNDLSMINDNHLSLIENIIESNKPNINVNFPKNILVEKNYNLLYFNTNNLLKSNQNYNLELNKDISLINGHEIKLLESSDLTTNFICRLSNKDVKFPLYIRNRRSGDRMCIKNMNGQRKISDIFIDSKISMDERNKWPIVVDSNGVIVWLPGLKKSKFDKQLTEKCDIILRYY